MDLVNWLKSIAERRWPILPATLVELRATSARHSDLISFSDLANLCLSDPLLLFDLLRVVGGSRALQRNESLPTVEQTLMLMGMEALGHRFDKLTPLQSVADKLSPEVLEAVADWLARGRVAALIVKEWLSLADEHKVEECFVAALLYNLPACLYLIYRNQLPDRPLLQEVSDHFATDYPRVLEQFVQAMPLPLGLLSMLGTGPLTPRRQLLKLAMATANSLEQGWWRSSWHVGIEAAAKLIGTDYAQAYGAVVRAVLAVARSPRSSGYTYPARALLQLQSDHQPSSMKTVATLAEPQQLEQAVREAIRYLANDLRFERIAFYRYERTSHELKLRYQVGLAENHPLRKLAVELEPGSFFALLTSKPQSFHAPMAVRAKLVATYQDAFFNHIGNGEFAVMTLFAGHELAGVFYVDNGNSGTAITQDHYLKFKECVTLLTRRQG
ncbi:MAG TPA: HDOD domain-containing protein [Chromobacteriaceae bacterium]|nr:HDOD domain-containing protein [Chromobacteriaceae bacterium]